MINFALDRSARTFDEDGRLRVALTPISKAAVNPYYGREIPGYAALGLDPDKIYNLLRDSNELTKAAETFNGVQLLDTHIPVNAENPQDNNIVGAIGTDTVFDGTYLRASLIVWDAEAIKAIENGGKKQLSSGYRYDPEMVSGVFDGQAYDGIMRNIRANHVALVAAGRAGPDVMVGDEAIESKNETIPATPVRAVDVSNTNGAKDTALNPLPKGQKPMPASQKAKLDAMLAKLTPYLAQDADPEKVKEALDEDETEEERKKREAAEKTAADEGGEGDEDDKKKKAKKDDDTAAMDAAIKSATDKVRADMLAVREAERVVQPLIGQVYGMDSADEIYAFALKQHGVETKGVSPSAFPAMVKMIGRRHEPRIAMDAGEKTLAELVPSIKNVRKA